MLTNIIIVLAGFIVLETVITTYCNNQDKY